jgi:hypothetical protein
MRKLFFLLPLAALFIDPLQAFGGTATNMQVSFVVLDRCTVDEAGKAAPAVRCSQPDDFIVEGSESPAVAKRTAGAKPGMKTDVQTAGKTAVTNAVKPDTAIDTSEDGWVVYF